MERSVYRVERMDCAAEESLVRSALEPMAAVRSVEADLGARRVTVYHDGDAEAIERAIGRLDLGSSLLSTEPVAEEEAGAGRSLQVGTLRVVLALNALFFVVEAASGVFARSMGLIADSLDMLADAGVYALSLAVVYGTAATKRRVARWSGYGQLALAALGLFEVLRRAFGTAAAPDDATMIVVAVLALGANVVTLRLLARARSGEAHMRASVIFTSNDVLVNLGVIVAGVLVALTGSGVPDLLVGAVVFVLVARGAARILALAS
ncbi:MAG: cation transporter [Deinococcales bacterium]